MRYAKQSTSVTMHMPPRDAYRFEQGMTVALSKSEDAKEAREAFFEKRKPVWKGRETPPSPSDRRGSGTPVRQPAAGRTTQAGRPVARRPPRRRRTGFRWRCRQRRARRI